MQRAEKIAKIIELTEERVLETDIMLEYVKWMGKDYKEEEEIKNHKLQIDSMEMTIEKDKEFVAKLKECFGL